MKKDIYKDTTLTELQKNELCNYMYHDYALLEDKEYLAIIQMLADKFEHLRITESLQLVSII